MHSAAKSSSAGDWPAQNLVCVVGAPRCGTTTLARWLRDHPAVQLSSVKEPHYFSRLRHDWSVDQVPRDYLSIVFRRWRDRGRGVASVLDNRTFAGARPLFPGPGSDVSGFAYALRPPDQG